MPTSVSQSDYLIQFVDTDSHTEWQTVQIQIRSQLIWIYSICKGRAYPGSAGPWLIHEVNELQCDKMYFMTSVPSEDWENLGIHVP